jgi:hypothetical protein
VKLIRVPIVYRLAQALFALFAWPFLSGENIHAQSTTGGFSVDISNREEVRSFFNALFFSGSELKSDWDASVAQCELGSTSAEFKDAVLRRINFFRAMAGVPANVVLDQEFSRKAQHAALIVSANGVVDHEPAETFSCFTPDGLEASDNSNLALGNMGMDAVEAYMLEAGSNSRAGHRRWLLYPQTKRMGTGDIDPPDGSPETPANAIWFFDENYGGARPGTRDGFIAWPPPGFVPYRLVYPRWSFSYPKADFTETTVTINGRPARIDGTGRGLGENSVVFVPDGIQPEVRMHWPKPQGDLVYTVNVENVRIQNTPTNFTYTVTVFDPETLAPDAVSPLLTGSAFPQIGRTNIFRLPLTPNASSYEFRVGTLLPLNLIEGAETQSPQVLASKSELYALVQGLSVASGQKAFQLAHSTPPRAQSFMLAPIIVPSSASQLQFRSRLGISSSNQVARVQVSLDDGNAWRDVYSQNGTGGAGEPKFSTKTISLSAYAGRAIRVRFEYGFTYAEDQYTPGVDTQLGWQIDDIQITASQELRVQTITTTIANPQFEFLPNETGSLYLDGRPRFFQAFGGEWTTGKIVSVVEPWALEPRVNITQIQRAPDNAIEIYFQALDARPNPFFRVESSMKLGQGWTPHPDIAPKVTSSETEYRLVLPASGPSAFFRIYVE